jgi:starch phosphorylase
MKAAANGALNCSILDGWWVEGYTQETGFAIGRGEEYTGDLEYQDKVESEALFDLLEKEIIPLFYDRGPDGLPRRWISLMQSALRQISPVFSSNRMVREYTERAYLPAILQWRTLLANSMARAKSLAAWKKRVQAAWPQVRIESWEDDCDSTAIVDDQFGVKVRVSLGKLKPDDVKVELYLGRVDVHGSITQPELVETTCTNPEAASAYDYSTIISCRAAGPHGYTVRVRPDHADMMSPLDLGLIYWADTNA